ncbi:hypothetical protein NP233_g12581 [Leucocoprinus birnbaumii]|uniref:Uncharacterized protein n=1 Tax=Leucocoprinus birnbaumii TaxID=56174 RepID=A0AAD5YMY1_9AGAR|nr:hypothetical protein NP233_g12581 [Leucocoprinus birnbaumii]
MQAATQTNKPKAFLASARDWQAPSQLLAALSPNRDKLDKTFQRLAQRAAGFKRHPAITASVPRPGA